MCENGHGVNSRVCRYFEWMKWAGKNFLLNSRVSRKVRKCPTIKVLGGQASHSQSVCPVLLFNLFWIKLHSCCNLCITENDNRRPQRWPAVAVVWIWVTDRPRAGHPRCRVTPSCDRWARVAIDRLHSWRGVTMTHQE